MTPAARAALLAVVLAAPCPVAAQQVMRGAGSGEAGVASQIAIDPSGLSAPITVTRGRVRPAAAVAAPPARCDCPRPTRIVVFVEDGGSPAWFGLRAQAGRTLHDPWYSWMRSYRLSLFARTTRVPYGM